MKDKKECPRCGQVMEKEDTGYAYLWSCKRELCGNMEGYWSIYDQKEFKKTLSATH